MLFREDILREMDNGSIEIENFNPADLGTNSYDMNLGQTFYEVIYDKHGPLFVGPQVYSLGDYVNIPVGGTLLGHTKDRIKTTNGIVGVLWSPSSLARIGISVCFNAGLGDDGFDSKWTLELSSHVRAGQPRITVGSRIVQMVFFRGETPAVKKYGGQYMGCEWPKCMIPKDYRDIPHRIVPTHSELLKLDMEL